MKALLVLGLLALAAVVRAQNDNPQLAKLKLNDQQLSKFTSMFGGIQRMTASAKSQAYSKQLIPYKTDAAHNVPQAVVTGLGYVGWTDSMYCLHPSCASPCPNPEPYYPTAWEYISNNPDLTIFTEVVKLIGDSAIAQLDGPVTGTLLIPTDTALASYLDTWQVQIDVNRTDAQAFYSNFFSKLITYHVLYERVYAREWEPRSYTTMYVNSNGYHSITWTACGGCTNSGGGSSSESFSSGGWGSTTGGGWGSTTGGGWASNSATHNSGLSCVGAGCSTPTINNQPIVGRHLLFKSARESATNSATRALRGMQGGRYGKGHGWSWKSRPSGGGNGCGCNIGKLIDEQKNVVTFATADKFIYGGGVLHTINEVLQPSDIFPSLGAALNSTKDFSYLSLALDVIANNPATNFSMLPLLETIGGSLAIPNNEAFMSAGIDPSNYNASDLLNTVAYHFCPFVKAEDLLYTPYLKKGGVNPCLTILSRSYNIKYGLEWNSTPNWGAKPDMNIGFATGSYPDGLTKKTACIVMADLTFPVHSGAIIKQLIIPPTDLPEPTSNTTLRAARRSGQSILVTTFRQSVRSAQLTSSAETVAYWRDRDQHTFLLAKRSARAATVGKTARRANVPQVDIQAMLDSYKIRRQKHDTNLEVALRRVESKLQRTKGGK